MLILFMIVNFVALDSLRVAHKLRRRGFDLSSLRPNCLSVTVIGAWRLNGSRVDPRVRVKYQRLVEATGSTVLLRRI